MPPGSSGTRPDRQEQVFPSVRFAQISDLHVEPPTLIAPHHPPFATGIAHMDAIGLDGAAAFADIVAAHPQIEAIVCGHLHRTISATVGGRRAMTAPSPAHQVALDLTPTGPGAFRMEPPGYLLHAFVGGRLVSHTALIEAFGETHPFFDDGGRLID